MMTAGAMTRGTVVAWLFFGAILLVLLMLLVNWATRSDRATVRLVARYLIWFLVGALALLLIARGLTGVAIALLVGAGALAWRKHLASRSRASRPDPARPRVDTRYVRITLNDATGDLDGVILAGRFAGRHLSELGKDDLTALYDELGRDDPEGAQLLDAYLARAYPGEWQEGEASKRGAGRMTREDAFEILGLAPGATPTDIKEAHHRLMKKFHPDQGGSTYFAARLNEAKDLLLKT
jgi:hypothetical protein